LFIDFISRKFLLNEFRNSLFVIAGLTRNPINP